MKRPLRFLVVFSIGLAALGGVFGLAEWAWSLMDDSFARDNAVWLRQIETETPLRAYTLPDVKNIRDCGGWKTQDGRRVRYGRLYRSGELNNVNPRRRKRNFTLSAASRAFFTDTLGIRTDIDLRSNTECDGMTGSPLGTNVVWRHIPSLAYARLDSPEGRKAFAKVFRTLLDEQAYPALIHCRAGRDRAGTAVFLLNALLGVPERDLRRDWEYSERAKRNAFFNYRSLEGVFEILAAHPGETVNARAEAFVHSLGFTDADFAKFRSLMLEDKFDVTVQEAGEKIEAEAHVPGVEQAAKTAETVTVPLPETYRPSKFNNTK